MRRASLVIIVLAAACGDDDGVHHLADSPQCTPLDSVVSVTAPTAYACHANYSSKVELTNNTCDPMTVTSIKLTPKVTSGQCGPAGAGTYPPMKAMLNPHETAVVLDLMSGPFCCTSPGCPATLQCDESFTFEVTTNAGTFSQVSSAHLSLDGCDVVCP